MKLVTTIIASLSLQIICFVWARWIDFIGSRSGYGQSWILGSLLPEGLFWLLTFINLILVGAYATVLYENDRSANKIITGLLIITTIMTLFYVPITQFFLRP